MYATRPGIVILPATDPAKAQTSVKLLRAVALAHFKKQLADRGSSRFAGQAVDQLLSYAFSAMFRANSESNSSHSSLIVRVIAKPTNKFLSFAK